MFVDSIYVIFEEIVVGDMIDVVGLDVEVVGIFVFIFGMVDIVVDVYFLFDIV